MGCDATLTQRARSPDSSMTRYSQPACVGSMWYSCTTSPRCRSMQACNTWSSFFLGWIIGMAMRACTSGCAARKRSVRPGVGQDIGSRGRTQDKQVVGGQLILNPSTSTEWANGATTMCLDALRNARCALRNGLPHSGPCTGL